VPRSATEAEPAALERALPLVRPELRPPGLRAQDLASGVLDLLGDAGPASTGTAQDLMLGRAVPRIYERWWRPAWGALATGVLGPGLADERRIARLLLGLTPGDGVLDVACGPGGFTRDFGRVVGPSGLAVGIDASPTMLARAVRETPPEAHPSVGFVRADATRLPFRDASFDAACCFLALHLMADPFAALDEMVRVLVGGGRLAIFTTCRTRTAPLRALDRLIGAGSGMRMFERDEITDALAARGLATVRRRATGLTQFVGARKPAPGGGDGTLTG
jgi:ubiquinone/menaquinone biosynthesis C-methylase UbiE